MCFSAPVSLISSGVLVLAGTGSMLKAKKNMRYVAAVPFIFAIQQFLEGMQWIAINSGAAALVIGYLFLFFAFLVWPVYIPLTVYLNEKNKQRRKIIKYFLIIGSLITVYLFAALYSQPMNIAVVIRSICYDINFPLRTFVGILYVLILCGSLFLSSDKYFRFFGLLMFVSSMFSWFVFKTTFTSVWCFFSAVLSVLIYLYFRRQSR
jgi:hypothetical protein